MEEREAEPYDELKVIPAIVAQGTNTLRAHLKHLRDHKKDKYYDQAVGYLRANGIPLPDDRAPAAAHPGGCPGSRSMAFTRGSARPGAAQPQSEAPSRQSQLTHWPIQLHLLSPAAPHYHGSDLLLSADCAAFALGDFHEKWLRGKTLAIACPKLDQRQDVYVEKLTALIDEAKINTLTVVIMQVPCCRGLLMLAQQAAAQAQRKVPIKAVVISLQGEVLQEQWL